MSEQNERQQPSMHDSGARRGTAEPLASTTPPWLAWLKATWVEVRHPLARSRFVMNALAAAAAGAMRGTYRSNRLAEGSDDLEAAFARSAPAIIALWHGQHLMTPCDRPPNRSVTAMVSRSADAEINALLLQKLGFETVRGSGAGRPRYDRRKGGAQALIGLKKQLKAGKIVAMMADTRRAPRQAGPGIVTLARISGRPILPVAVATSRRLVIPWSWDKTTINLPFGRRSIVVGTPIFVPADADEAALEAKRIEVTERLTAATDKAYALVDRRR